MQYLLILILNLQLTFIIDNKEIFINDIMINSTNYIEINDLPQILCYSHNCEIIDGIIYSKDFTLKTAANSFYIVYSNSDSLKVGQMTLPALKQNNKILIPLYPFLNALKGLKLIDFQINKNNLVITKKLIERNLKVEPEIKPIKSEITIENETRTLIISPNENIPEEPAIKIKPEEPAIKINFDTTAKKIPNYYEVPKNIKRSGIK